MTERGATEDEVLYTMNQGTPWSALPPKLGREQVFREGYVHRGREYPHKQVRVVYTEEARGTTVVTVIVRYGEWEDEDTV